MCGIFGYIGARDPLSVCLSGLEQLEYRGYDSSGIGGIHKGKIAFCKKAGKLSALKKELSLPSLDLAIAHTRWATHGKVTDENAHPHLDASNSIALIHNGIIENYAELRQELKKEGIEFLSDTDTEVIAQLIAKYYKGNPVEALHQTVKRLKGIFAFIVIHKDHPTEIYATARGCPLSIGYDDARTETMLSSDPNAFQVAQLNVLFLQADEIASVGRQKIDIFDEHLKTVLKKTERLDGNSKPPSKEGFEHYMLKEIYEQPITIQKAFLGRCDQEVCFEQLGVSDDFFHKIKQIYFLGAGTSAHAGKIGALLIEDIVKIPAQCEIASEARYRIPLLTAETLIIAISQSGETADTLAAMREARKYGCKILVICNVKTSTMMREADAGILLQAGAEISVCSTKAFTSQLTVLSLLALYIATIKKRISSKELHPMLEHLKNIPGQIQKVLDSAADLKILAKKYATYKDFFFMGRRYMFYTACEAALKLKEISYLNANGYPAGELKHGPIALLDSRFPVVAFCANHQTEEKIASSLMEVKARGAPVFAIASEGQLQISSIADDLFLVPNTIDIFAPFSSAVAGQLFAYYIAKERGCDIDQPRNLAKSVTVE